MEAHDRFLKKLQKREMKVGKKKCQKQKKVIRKKVVIFSPQNFLFQLCLKRGRRPAHFCPKIMVVRRLEQCEATDPLKYENETGQCAQQPKRFRCGFCLWQRRE
jgi:hypothetical protein